MIDLYWTGVGTREPTPEAEAVMTLVGVGLNSAPEYGFVLRSGKAKGSDTCFQLGTMASLYTKEKRYMEIYTPWKNFENPKVPDLYDISLSSLPTSLVNEAWDYVKQVHPNYKNLTPGERKLHTRNVFQVLGKDLQTPSMFVLMCATWASDHSVFGGTNTAFQVARMFDIPVLNVYDIVHDPLFQPDKMDCVHEILDWCYSITSKELQK